METSSKDAKEILLFTNSSKDAKAILLFTKKYLK